jgi:integrase
VLAEVGLGRTARASPPTVREACERWLATQDRDRANKNRHIHWLQLAWGVDTMIDALDHEQIIGLPARLTKPLGERAKVKSRHRRGEGNGRRLRKGDGLSPGTIRSVCQTGSRVLEFSTQMGWRTHAKIPLPSVPITDSEWFTIEELATMLRVAGEWQLAFRLGARAGLRRGEIVELRWQDVDLANTRIRISRAYKRDDVTGEWKVGPPKGGRPRTVPIPPDLVHALANIAGPRDQLVVQTTDGDRIQPWRLTEAVFKTATDAGITRPGIGAHALRHTYCSHLAQGGAPTRAIQALAGHASLRTTERYMHLAASHIEQAITHLPALGETAETLQKHHPDARPTPALRLC